MTPIENEHHDRFLRCFAANELAIRAYMRRLAPTRSDADDVMQDVCVALWREFEEFHEKDSFQALFDSGNPYR